MHFSFDIRSTAQVHWFFSSLQADSQGAEESISVLEYFHVLEKGAPPGISPVSLHKEPVSLWMTVIIHVWTTKNSCLMLRYQISSSNGTKVEPGGFCSTI